MSLAWLTLADGLPQQPHERRVRLTFKIRNTVALVIRTMRSKHQRIMSTEERMSRRSLTEMEIWIPTDSTILLWWTIGRKIQTCKCEFKFFLEKMDLTEKKYFLNSELNLNSESRCQAIDIWTSCYFTWSHVEADAWMFVNKVIAAFLNLKWYIYT